MIELSVSFVEYPKEIKDLAGKDHQLLLTSQKKRKSSFLLEKTTPLKYFCQKIRAEPKSAQALIFDFATPRIVFQLSINCEICNILLQELKQTQVTALDYELRLNTNICFAVYKTLYKYYLF